MVYVQRKEGKNLETVDCFDTRKEAKTMLLEYRISDSAGFYYLSQKPCKNWNN